MSLTSGDIEELTKELKEHWWKDFTTEDVAITPNDPLYQGEEITMLFMPMLVND